MWRNSVPKLCDSVKSPSMFKYVTVSNTQKRKTEADSQSYGSLAKKPQTQWDQENKNGLVLHHMKGDLFRSPVNDSLSHCISADIHMGKGIAALFKKKFGGVQELRDQKKSKGDIAVLKREGRYIYYLVTKEKYWQKPTYESLRSSLECMKAHCLQHNVLRLSMPRIGCGLDRLEWHKVEDMIKTVFGDTNMAITVYSL